MSQTAIEKIGSWLLIKGHTKRGLAKELGISVSTLNNRLSGKCGWKWNEGAKLVELGICSASDLL